MKALIAKINRAVNEQLTYMSDARRDKRGRLDYWQTPHETVKRGAGDCEDYAILKMELLKAILPESKLRLLHVLTDKSKSHMVLAVYLDDEDPTLLDCRYDQIFTLSQTQYRVMYSLTVHGHVYDHEGVLSASRARPFDQMMERAV